MEVTMLRDKLNIGMRLRLDNLSINEKVLIEMLIERDLKEREEYLKDWQSDREIDKTMAKYTFEAIESYKSMLSVLKDNKVIQLDCYRDDVEQESFETIIKKYKKIK